MTAVTKTYQGVGFTGRCPAEVTVPKPIETSPAPESEVDTCQPAESGSGPPTLHCLSCNSKTILLPSRRAWCPSCQTSSQVRDGGSASTIAAFIGALLLLVFVLFYVQGTFDHSLYDIGLNWETCGRGLSAGEILCGDQLGAGTNGVGESFENGVRLWLW